MLTRLMTCFSAILLTTSAFAARSYPMPPKNVDLIGKTQYVYPQKGDNIYNIARRYNLGYYELIEANPGMPRHSRLETDKKVVIPTEYVLPNTPREGIVINLPELRLYYYNNTTHRVFTGPIAIGRFNWDTPVMESTVIRKYEDPVWQVPESIKEESAKKGIYLPDIVKPGPKNPLGDYALRLGRWSYLIHGTNAPNSIGKRASSGCMRMFPESIEQLFQQVPIGTPVRIIDEPVKLGWDQGKLYMEAHEPLRETARPRPEQIQHARDLIHAMTDGKPIPVNWHKVDEVLERESGIPTVISGKVDYSTQDYAGEPVVDSGYSGY